MVVDSVGISRQNSNTCSNAKLRKPDLLDLPLIQAPVVGSHVTPGGQCSHPVMISGFSSGFGNVHFISSLEKAPGYLRLMQLHPSHT